ncbi:glycosyltransferase family 2 protein [Mangrovibrevibacter kandeliae]|uniref:glycosyltransferase family 2 protein n=1 Tax=Mangrovibrevibacter kandeliae TaxID=2968473 RepID=UPI0021185D7D|nr:glycosyltransferase family 2 protein [Aurantimonas sp. CSK15Z-1]MCQ8782824.1 glycosyltransferase [Aurantimonas sp. CSK15Z-1]
MLNTAARVSIVMPNYNHGEELRISLPPIVGQTRPADEIIIVDDGSTDDSRDVIASFQAENPSIRLVRHATRQGVVAAVNRGIAEASGDYVVLVSADERIMPTLCAEMLDALALKHDAKLVVSHFTEWSAETGETRHGVAGVEDLSLWFLGETSKYVSPQEFGRLLGERPIRLSANSAMFDRAALLEVGCFDPALRWHSDWFAIYAVAARYGFCAVPRVLSLFRVSEKSYSVAEARSLRARQEVALALAAKLDEPQFADVRRFLLKAPSALSPFMRPLLLGLLGRPQRYPMLARLVGWWLSEVARGRRPGALLRLKHRLRGAALRS